MPTRIMTPATRSAGSPWLLWTDWVAAATAISDVDPDNYAGAVPSTTWAGDGTGSPSLVQAVATQGDALNAKASATGSVQTRHLLVEFAANATLSGKTLQSVKFRVARRRQTGAGSASDFHVFLTKAGVCLTAIDAKLVTAWTANDTTAELVYYTFTAAQLATLGVSASDMASGIIGIAIQATTTATVQIFVDHVGMSVAYSPSAETVMDNSELPGGTSTDTAWLRIYDWSPQMPGTDIVNGIEVDLMAWTNDPAAGGGGPVGGRIFRETVAEIPPGDTMDFLGEPIDTPGGTDIPVAAYPLEVALSLDGSTVAGDTFVFFPTATVQLLTIGTPTEKWGSEWVPTDFAGGFSVLIRRPAWPSSVSSHYVTTARVRVTATSEQGTLTMATRQELTEIVLLGAESTPGTLATTVQRMRALNYKSRPNTTVKKFRPQGEKMQGVVVPVREWSSGSISGMMDYNELPLALEAIIGAGAHSGTGVANERNVHVYSLDNRVRSIYKTFSLQRGEKATRAHQHTYLVHSGLQLQINTQDCQVSGAFFAQKISDGITMKVGANEVQTITVTGTPTGGTFRLAFRGSETADLAYNITNSALQSALELLDTVGTGDIVISGTGPFTATFSAALAAENQPMLTLVKNSLTGGSSPSVTVAQTTKGGHLEYPLVPVLPSHWNIYLADTQAGLGAGKLDKSVGVAATGIDIADRWTPFWTLDRDTEGGFTDTTEMDPKFTANLMVGANSTGMALLNSLRSGATKWLRMEAVGPVIGATADTHKMIWEGPVKVADTADFGNEDGRVVFPWPLEWCEGPNGEVPFLQIENGIVY